MGSLRLFWLMEALHEAVSKMSTESLQEFPLFLKILKHIEASSTQYLKECKEESQSSATHWELRY